MSAPMIDALHTWYYDTRHWEGNTWGGVPMWKLLSDCYTYQEIIAQLQPGVLVEFGRGAGGFTLFLDTLLLAQERPARILSVDIADTCDAQVRESERIELLNCSSVNECVARRIAELRVEYPGPLFAILDSDHRAPHVLAELESLRPVTRAGDYVVVEDGNINGHPVLPHWGPGPAEALAEYHTRYPGDYVLDLEREQRYLFTFAPGGYLMRR